ncbi:sigma-B regulation protein RsbU (phosphoserine phosphatase) [Lutimaribacter pacificus]|uniref:Sigma-B regulation protein RsbU (Phosphoserine phosphatase) n=1 Tax=Lutimaribacter pacificus TaxID=391948 RepID=A0A1H0EJ97_9RHOB|nr:SpoIIE family protein phosphatase [Lutimaribacter pacificus]SDN82411.1 sigma-B regulation protein RsbU (phosphoserine phosphatase) [Lutimaribacter pacificus]SHK52478.1 sigma-B regulation protein RsbU (phosphoserine phosphatase) [Lutimaribacter pacificus]
MQAPPIRLDARIPGDAGPLRVLVVDDSRAQRRILVASLGQWGFDVVEADSGHSALEQCLIRPPDLVLSDWMMPGMDGLEFCRRFRGMRRDSYGYFILLTSRTEKESVTRGLDCGADDFLTKPVDTAELRARINAGQRVLRMERELQAKSERLAGALDELQGLYDAIDRDLVQARKIQESLVPERFRAFGPTQVSMLLKPCGHVGGDLVGLFCPGENRIGLYSIDVSGHGITSALMTARIASYLSGRFLNQNIALQRRLERFFVMRPPGEVARILNDRLLSDAGVEEYFTMVYATIDLRSGMARMVQAGHPHPVLQRADGRVEFLGEGGLPIGLIAGAQYRCFEVAMIPGDRLLLYSDGFTESEDGAGAMLGEDGLAQMLAHHSGRSGPELLDDMFWTLHQREGGTRMADDVSAVLLDYFGPE